MQNSRKLWGGLAGGLILAFAGPAGIAVGHSSHPVQESSHPDLGQLFGTVTDTSGNPLDGVCVETEHRWRSRWDRERTRTTGGGHYLFHSLRPGAHLVRVDPNCSGSPVRGTFAAEWFDDARTRDRAASIRIASDQTSIADVELDLAGSITVSATDAFDARVATCLTAYPADMEPFDVSAPDQRWFDAGGAASSGRTIDGAGRLLDLPSGEYRVLVGCLGDQGSERPAPFGYIPRWLPSVTVAAPAATEVQASLTRAGVIAGTVTDQFGAMRAARITAWETRSSVASHTYGQADGFETGRLSPGTYRIGFNDRCSWYYSYDSSPYPPYFCPSSHADGDFSEFYDGHAATFAAATPVDVNAGAATQIAGAVDVRGSDLAITELTVTDPEIRTAAGYLASPGVRKEITVSFAQLGAPYDEGVDVCIWAESRGGTEWGSRHVIAHRYVSVGAGDSWTRSFSWTPTSIVGDISIHARVQPDYWWGGRDIQPSNNERSVDTYVAAGGLGGYGIPGVGYVPFLPSSLNPFAPTYC